MIPDIGLPLEISRDPQPFQIGIDLKFLLVAFQHDKIALVDETDLGHFAAVAITHHIRVDRIVPGGRRTEKHGGALKETVVGGLPKKFSAILLSHIEFETSADPGQWRVSEGGSFRS